MTLASGMRRSLPDRSGTLPPRFAPAAGYGGHIPSHGRGAPLVQGEDPPGGIRLQVTARTTDTHPADPLYRARYSDIGDLLPGQNPRRAENTSPYAGREAEIQAMADRLQQDVAQRATGRPPAASRPSAPADRQEHQQTPRIR
jgi:hypothetical protein